MPLLRNERRLGGNIRRGLGLTLDAANLDLATDGGGGYFAPVVDPGTLAVQSPPVIQDQPAPIDDYIPPPADSTTPVAMPSSVAASQPLDGSAPITAPVTLPDNTVAPVGSYVTDTPNAIVVNLADGSSRIIYKSQPIVDRECQNYDTQDINDGLFCQYNVGVAGKADYFELRYIPTERWTGQVQSAGELRANMDRAAALNAQFPDSARRGVWYNNPSWHMVTNAPNDVYDRAKFPDSYVPTYIGPTTTSGGSSMYVVTDDGTKIDVTDNDNVTPEQQQQIIDAVYGPVADRAPGQPGYVPPVYSGPPLDSTGSVIHDDDPGSVGGGNGNTGIVPRPPYSGPVSTPNTTVNAAPAGGSNAALLVAAAAAAFLLFGRRR